MSPVMAAINTIFAHTEPDAVAAQWASADPGNPSPTKVTVRPQLHGEPRLHEVVGTLCGARIEIGLFEHRTRTGGTAGPRYRRDPSGWRASCGTNA